MTTTDRSGQRTTTGGVGRGADGYGDGAMTQDRLAPSRLSRFAAVAAACVLAWCTGGPAVAEHGPPELHEVPPSVADRSGELPENAHGAAHDLVDVGGRHEARGRELREFLRANRSVLEKLPSDDLVVRSEVLALDPTEAALARAAARGFLVARERSLAGLGARMVVLTAPPGVTTVQALDALRALDPGGAYDFNHVYFGSGETRRDRGVAAKLAQRAGQPHEPAVPTIGMIDGGVAAEHPAFSATTVVARGFESPGYAESAHGTAVASILVAEESGPVRLLVADVYGGAPAGGAADAVAAALSWMAEERAPVINISLVGPENALLDVVLARVVARGQLIVAPVGNEGPAAPPLFPAAHPDVIAVTAVDSRDRVLIEACRGPHVMFAARGDDVRAAALNGKTTSVRGTSFAAPVVTRRLAALLAGPSPNDARAAVQTLVNEARDLGPPGRDATYGYGLIDGDSTHVVQASQPGGSPGYGPHTDR
jgi:hypothetical protein